MPRPKIDNPKSKMLNVRFEETEVDDLDLYARSLGLSRSRYVRQLVREGIARERARERKQKGRK